MTIFLCVLGWIACGFLAVWIKYAIIDQREFDIPLVEAMLMASVFGACLLIGAVLVLPIVISSRCKGKVLWRAKK